MNRRTGALAALVFLALAALLWLRGREEVQRTPAEAGATAMLDIAYRDDVPGERTQLDIYLPDGDGPHPSVVWIHPGGWTAGDKSRSMPVWDWTDRGYAIVALNYRYAVAPHTVADSVDDAITAMEFVFDNHAEWALDPRRIGIFGFSAGGHLAAMAATTPLPIAAVATSGAPTDFALLLDPEVPFFDGETGPDVVAATEALLGCDGSACGPLAESLSPAALSAPSMPVLVAHGAADPIVEVAHAEQYHEQLVASGGDAQLLVVAGGGHGSILDEPDFADFFDRILLRDR